MKQIRLKVNTLNQKYQIIIGNNILNNIQKLLKENSINYNQSLVVVDKNVPIKLLKKILTSLKKKPIIYYFNANEKNKNQKSVNKILSILLKSNFNRNDCLISVGGGITGDVSAFAASIFKRGIKFVNVPTTLLSQVDSSIGGKTGINTINGKNLIGTFYQPHLVISEIEFLKYLPKREIMCGYREILKHSLIADKSFFLFLNKNGTNILNLKSPLIENTIYKSCYIKKKVVENDEKEKNLRKILNFGHTFAHAFEATLGYSKKLNHGEAVLLGIRCAIRFSLVNKILNIREFRLIEKHFNKLNLPRNINNFLNKSNCNKVLSFMRKDKKNYTNKLNLVLIKKIGSPIYGLEFSEKKINSFLKRELAN